MQTRRSFIGQMAAAATAAGILPSRLRAQAARRLILTAGDRTYECIHDWLKAPEGLVWGDTHGICQDRQGFIYVAHTVHPKSKRAEAIVVFDENGRYVRAFGEEFRSGAHGLDLRQEGGQEILYHCDTVRRCVVKTSLTGEVLWTQGYPAASPLYAVDPRINFVPTNAAFAPNGDFFVGDGYGSSYILKFSAQGELLQTIGTPGKADGQLQSPHGLWVDSRGAEPVLVVADRGNHRLQTFSLDGRHLRTISDPARLRWPCNFDVRGDLLVCPDLNGQVCLLDRDYQVIAQIGDGLAHNTGKIGSRRDLTRDQFIPGEFIYPHDAVFLRNGDIVVVEWLPIGRITLLSRLG
jgi:sugar lactone lactonase YvrE